MTTQKKVALITGVTGQDGAYLAELLLGKGYEVLASNAAHRYLIPTVSTTSTKTRTKAAASLFFIMAT